MNLKNTKLNSSIKSCIRVEDKIMSCHRQTPYHNEFFALVYMLTMVIG